MKIKYVLGAIALTSLIATSVAPATPDVVTKEWKRVKPSKNSNSNYGITTDSSERKDYFEGSRKEEARKYQKKYEQRAYPYQ